MIILKTWNDNLSTFKQRNSKILKQCIMKIYKTVFDGANFPFEREIYKEDTRINKILIQDSNSSGIHVKNSADRVINKNLKIQNL